MLLPSGQILPSSSRLTFSLPRIATLRISESPGYADIALHGTSYQQQVTTMSPVSMRTVSTVSRLWQCLIIHWDTGMHCNKTGLDAVMNIMGCVGYTYQSKHW